MLFTFVIVRMYQIQVFTGFQISSECILDPDFAYGFWNLSKDTTSLRAVFEIQKFELVDDGYS